VPRTAFVTGGTGFLGRHVVEQLAEAGWRVMALHREASDIRHLKAAGAELALGSLTDPASLARAIPEGCDTVFHIAGNTSLWSGGDEEQTRENVGGTRNVVEAALARGAKRYVQTSSVAAFGHQDTVPFDETAKSHALDALANYTRTKYLGEVEVEKGIEKGLAAVILNPGHIMGRYDTTGWARVIRLVHAGKLPGIPPGAGTFAGAREVARAHIVAAEKGRVGERYLLGGADGTFVDMVRIIGEVTGRKVPQRAMPLWVVRALGRVSQWGSYVTHRAPRVTPEIADGMAAPHYFKSDKAMRELGYRAVPLDEMIRESYDWLKAEGRLG
jgi:dihydroflavonol-4-reductase